MKQRRNTMGTHAMIGTWDKETGKVTASYVHYDGYLEGVGRTLTNSYNNEELANKVAKGGYLSSLDDNYAESRLGSVHSDPATTFGSISDFIENGYTYGGADFLYLWDGVTWFFSCNKTFEEVEMNLQAA
jgi:hypothetical protein